MEGWGVSAMYRCEYNTGEALLTKVASSIGEYDESDAEMALIDVRVSYDRGARRDSRRPTNTREPGGRGCSLDLLFWAKTSSIKLQHLLASHRFAIITSSVSCCPPVMQYQDHRLASYSTHYATIATSTTTTTKSRSTISKASSSSSSSSSTVEWPLTYPSLTPEALAQAGFYFTPDDADDEEDDQVTCFLCEKKLGGWEEGDDPLEEHAKRGDRCGWAKAVCGVLLEAKEKKEKSGKGRKGKRCVGNAF